MKTPLLTSSLTLLLLTTSTTALAFPNIRPLNTYPLATLQLANDLTGANALRSLPANGAPTTLAALFAGSALVRNGALKATSLQNVAPGVAVRCVLRRPGGEEVGSVSEQVTWLDLDGDKEGAREVDVAAWTVACQ
ncbi:hypothetical protein B5807_11388 [Epicoccum nigrum]|uniref:Uncharacterized protein n=1 Tax=Epicoccum nigrum TaxID=105696 RepID=A0A1Y2LJS0_EPING|nr:hypothetical protein B5807_11388 [Epicoccum nigrum]